MVLRDFAKRFSFGFALIMIVTTTLTYTVTDYADWTDDEKQIKDKITKFYQIWNPCIMFDHYPANIIKYCRSNNVVFSTHLSSDDDSRNSRIRRSLRTTL